MNAAVKMRALLESSEPGLDASSSSSSLRATFFRFLDANGAVLPPPENYGGSLEFGGGPPSGEYGSSSSAPLDKLLTAAWDWGAEIRALRRIASPTRRSPASLLCQRE